MLVADPAGVVTVIRFLCSSCRATWQMLPAFVARHLWRSWPTVEETVEAPAPPPTQSASPTEAPVPASTQRRWLRRLAASAALLVVTVATAETPPLTTVAGAVGLAGTRHALVHEHAHMANVPVGQRLTQMAALLHRLAPGVRLM